MSKTAKPKTKKPSLGGPRIVNEEVWYYEDALGLTVCDYLHYGLSSGALNKDGACLPWNMVCSSVDHYRAVQRAKKLRKDKATK